MRNTIREETPSDYGSDIELDDVTLNLLDSATVQPRELPSPPTTDFAAPTQHLRPHGPGAEILPVSGLDFSFGKFEHPTQLQSTLLDQPLVKLEFPTPEVDAQSNREDSTGVAKGLEKDDTRSPYEKYRSRRKALSVTDLVSAVWCEQQFEYTLQQGFKTRTPQMKKGTDVHRVLEKQVHDVVEVRQVKTSEDKWGLKLFNMYQGLCTLEETGLTRELPAFGFMDDIFVQGVIDEITYIDPETRLAEMTSTTTLKGEPRKRSRLDVDKGQLEHSRDLLDIVPLVGNRTAYISDTKTRASRTVPSASQSRATALQLMLYRNLLLGMRNGDVDFAKFLDWFKLDGNQTFSDGFVAEIAGIDGSLSLEKLLENNSLWGMWLLLQEKLAVSLDSVGTALGVSYRTQTDGALIRFTVMRHDTAQLDQHMESTMRWWNGSRGTVGVEIEEAWKCRSCEFADRCTWRLGKIEQLTQSAKLRSRRSVTK